MEVETPAASKPDTLSAAIRRVTVMVVCVALFASFGVAAPYKIYRYFEAKQHAAAVAVPHEEP